MTDSIASFYAHLLLCALLCGGSSAPAGFRELSPWLGFHASGAARTAGRTALQAPAGVFYLALAAQAAAGWTTMRSAAQRAQRCRPPRAPCWRCRRVTTSCSARRRATRRCALKRNPAAAPAGSCRLFGRVAPRRAQETPASAPFYVSRGFLEVKSFCPPIAGGRCGRQRARGGLPAGPAQPDRSAAGRRVRRGRGACRRAGGSPPDGAGGASAAAARAAAACKLMECHVSSGRWGSPIPLCTCLCMSPPLPFNTGLCTLRLPLLYSFIAGAVPRSQRPKSWCCVLFLQAAYSAPARQDTALSHGTFCVGLVS